MVAQLVQNLVHLERCRHCLDKDGCANRAARNTKLILCEIERVIPNACLAMALHLRQVEIWPAAAFYQFSCVVKKVEAEIEQPACYGFAVDQHVFFTQMPAAWPDHQHRDIVL